MDLPNGSDSGVRTILYRQSFGVVFGQGVRPLPHLFQLRHVLRVAGQIDEFVRVVLQVVEILKMAKRGRGSLIDVGRLCWPCPP